MKRFMALTAVIALLVVWIFDGTESVITVLIAAIVSVVGAGIGWLAIGFLWGGLSEPSNNRRHQKRETDVNGTVIAYRRLYPTDTGEFYSVTEKGMANKINPVTGVQRGYYQNGWNASDRVPTLKNTSGIYAAKTPDSPILENYPGVLARVELSGRVIEGEDGYRAQYCRVVEVLE